MNTPGDSSREPVLIYQMGKVGSSALYAGLKAAWPGPVFQIHTLNPKRLDKACAAFHGEPPPHILDSLTVCKLQETEQHCKVITLVRDPVRRNMSDFFQNIDRYIPNFIERYRHHELSIHDATAFFVDSFFHDVPIQWFDIELKAMLGIDALATPFPTERGYTLIPGNRAEVLVMRYEDLARVARPGLRELLNIDCGELPRANDSDQKEYRDAYAEFKQSLHLPDDLINRLYDSPYTRHFYTADEIAAMRKRERRWQI